MDFCFRFRHDLIHAFYHADHQITMNHLLEIDSLTLNFGTRNILNNIYLQTETGKITALLGRNGSGKSCLFRCAFSDLEPQNISVRIDGKKLKGLNHKFPDIAYLPQFNFIPRRLTVESVFHDFELDIKHFIRLFPDFETLIQHRVRLLSGGQARILETYIVIMAKSRFCILDEPFSHLMPINVEIFIQLILSEKKKKGFIISDHMFRYILDLYDDLYLLKDGRCIKLKDEKELVELGYLNWID